MTDKRRAASLSDVMCSVACVSILAMSIISFTYTSRFGYEVATGVFCGIFCLMPMILDKIGALRLPTVFVAVILVAIGLHAYGVLLLSYDLISYYDTITHFVSSLVVALCVFYTLICYQVYSNGKLRFTGARLAIAIAMIMLGFSAYWEVFEFIVDVLTGTSMQYSPFDTLRDMLCNTTGTIVVSIYAGMYTRKNDLSEVVDRFGLHPRLRAFIMDPFGERKSE